MYQNTKKIYKIDPEESALFRKEVSKLSLKKENVENLDSEVFFPLSDHYTEFLEADNPVNYFSEGSGLEPNILKLIKNGEYLIDHKVDLHGDTIESARTRLCQSLQKAWDLQSRLLLIVHGKGQQAKLKNHVIHWLKQIPFILFFCSAASKDGGTGAVYVFLKRKKIDLKGKQSDKPLDNSLNIMRKKIDEIDEKITTLLCQRLYYAKQVALSKKTTAQDFRREQEILAKVGEQTKQAGYCAKYIEKIFQAILVQMREYQKEKN